ncbi:MAG: Gx transporter family protein [Lentisphaerae bacterium]|nr:Gx transporter family protein [Lentisphaerota bacterium]
MKEDKPTIAQARLVALAAVLQIAEAFFPHPIPGVRLGLANVVTLIALVRLGSGCALEITALRTVIASLAVGTFLTPTFIISFVAALGSTGAMIFFQAFLKRGGGRYFSIIGVSLVGAACHNIIQLAVAYLLIIRHSSIMLLAPWLGISAVLAGWLTGIIALRVCRKLSVASPGHSALAVVRQQPDFCRARPAETGGERRTRRFALQTYIRGEGTAPSAPTALKIMGLFLLAPLVLFVESLAAFGLIALGLLAVSGLAGLSVRTLLGACRRQTALLFIAFLMPALFNGNGDILWAMGFLTITREGLLMGASFAARLLLLMAGATLLVRTTSQEELARGFEQILRSVGFSGPKPKRISSILILAWLALPALGNRVRAFFSGRDRAFCGLMSGLIDFMAELYKEAEFKEA